MIFSTIATCICFFVCWYFARAGALDSAIIWGVVTLIWMNNVTIDSIKKEIDANNN